MVNGAVIAPGDVDYDRARAVYFTATDRRPLAIVRASGAADVMRVIALARETGCELAVRGGGHSIVSHGVCDGGIVLDLSALRSLEIDVERRSARAGAGITAGEFTHAAAAHGLATGFGDAPSVCATGITLAGGVGFLHRKYGMTIDNLLAAELVTADGQVLRADATSHPDLFWAIRGGGGNFGVVTSLELQLHEVDTVLGGMLFLPASSETVAGFLAAALAAPDELGVVCAVMPAPPLPFIPAAAHGSMVIMGTFVYAGDLGEGERALAPFRALASPLLDAVRPMPYPEIYQGHEHAPQPPAVAMHTCFIDDFDVAAAARLLERLRTGNAFMRMAQFRPLGGAVARVPAAATAFAHRDRRCIANIGAVYADPREADAQEAWVADVASELPEHAPGAYSAFLGRDGAERIREAYPGETWERLAAIKRRYDPDNLFRGNHNIAPAPAR